jgi:hypothetical protein
MCQLAVFGADRLHLIEKLLGTNKNVSVNSDVGAGNTQQGSAARRHVPPSVIGSVGIPFVQLAPGGPLSGSA